MKPLGRAGRLTLAAVLAVKLLFLVTYPINISGDGATYYQMMRYRLSNLAHASGYPWLVTLPLAGPRALLKATIGRLTGGERRPDAAGTTTAHRKAMRVPGLYVSIANHLLDALAVMCLFLVLREAISVPAAVLGALVYGLDPWNVQWATLTRPEQVQSNVLVLLLGAVYLAYRLGDGRRKALAWAAAGVLFVLGVLVKYNALFLLPLPALALLLDARPWRARAGYAAAATGAGLAFYWAFIVLFHAPTTGTYDLAYARGHNLFVRLERNPTPLYDPDNGLASRKLAILVRELPPEPVACCGATLFAHLDFVPPEERRPHRERFLPLLATRDAAEVERWWMAVRDRPAGKQTSIHYYIGLAEADRLLSEVFFETVRARPAAYLAGSWRFFVNAFSASPDVLVPVVTTALGVEPPLDVLARPDAARPLGLGFVRLPPDARSRVLGYDKSAAVWRPGAYLVTGALAVTRVPTLLLWLLAAAGAALAIASGGEGAADPPVARWGPALLVALLVVFIAAWSLVFDFRNKDLRLVQPLLTMLATLGVYQTVRLLRRAVAPASRAWS
jgi:hypothetical protein